MEIASFLLWQCLVSCLSRLPAATNKDIEVWRRREEADRIFFNLSNPALQDRADSVLLLEKHLQQEAYALQLIHGDSDTQRLRWIWVYFWGRPEFEAYFKCYPFHLQDWQADDLFLTGGIWFFSSMRLAFSAWQELSVLHLYHCHLVMQCPLLAPGHKISEEATSDEASRTCYCHIQIGVSAEWGHIVRIPLLFQGQI